jgi:acetyltransferase-like isoleucine patch superfamily enzyme
MKKTWFARFLRWCPGALGILLRQRFYPYLLQSCGRGVLFGRFIDFQNTKNIYIGDNVVIGNRCSLLAGGDAGNGQSIVIEEDVFIGIGTLLQANNGSISIQKGSNVGSECRVMAKRSVTIGRNVLVAAYCLIGDGVSHNERISSNTSTRIGDNVWLGARSEVFCAVHIGEGAIIGAHAMVNSDIRAYGIAMGRPASIVRYRK